MSDLSPEADPVRIEAAMLELARASAAAGARTLLSDGRYPPGVRTPLGHLIVRPLPMAAVYAEAALLMHLIALVGQAEADEVRQRINGVLHDEFDRPRIKAAGPKQ